MKWRGKNRIVVLECYDSYEIQNEDNEHVLCLLYDVSREECSADEPTGFQGKKQTKHQK